MSHTPHELTDEFPEQAEQISTLKASDSHFNKLTEQYHHLAREIHRIETDVEPASDEVLHDLKKKRLALLDEISAMLAA